MNWFENFSQISKTQNSFFLKLIDTRLKLEIKDDKDRGKYIRIYIGSGHH